MCKVMGIEVASVEKPDDQPISVEEVREALAKHPDVTNVFIVHCEVI